MNSMNKGLLTLCLILLAARAEAAGTTPWKGWWPWSMADRACPHCCNDYVPKTLPCASCLEPGCLKNDYCPKILPCVQPVTCFGCNDYCPKTLPCTAPCDYPSWYTCYPVCPALPCQKAP